MFRNAESHEHSPEPASYHKATDELDQSTSDAVPSAGVPAADTAVVDEGYFQLPEPPDLSAFVPSLTSLPADGAQQPLEDSRLESENVDADGNESEAMVNFICTLLDLTYLSLWLVCWFVTCCQLYHI